MSNARRIKIAEKFGRFPAGRSRNDGPFSGEAFRDQFLIKPLQQGEHLIIDLNGTAGYGSSFLEEAFGGLVRAGLNREKIINQLEFESDDASLIDEIEGYVRAAR